ncbi:DUF6297 family protein [Actinokineospora pegani]|uniref:DUF6297 family protein n=1 Tax=Actinokineospora pegani TaxID=2654637 RepID=UPI0012EA01FA|nr:DUF6297 family protein [Actinokineospora pegani]
MTTEVPTAGAARRVLRSYRSRRVSARQRLADLVLGAAYVAMVLGLGAGAAQVGFERAVARAPDGGALVLRQWGVALGVVLVTAAWAKVALVLGPVLVRGPAQSWLLSTPIDRRALLGGRFVVVLWAGCVSGALVALLAVIAGGGEQDAVVGALVAGGAIGVSAAATAVSAQTSAARVRRVQVGLNVVLGLCAAGMVAVPVVRPGTFPTLPAGGVVVAVVVAGVVVWFAQAGLARLSRAQLAVGADVAEATTVATTFLEPTILWGVLLVKRARRVGRVRSVRLRGNRFTALVAADLVRVRRAWTGLAVWVGLLPVPYLAEATVSPAALPAVHVIAAFLAADRLAGGLRIICRSPALRRLLGGGDRELVLAHLVVPATGAVVWCAVTAPALPGMAAVVCVLSAVGSVLVIHRMAARPPIEYTNPVLELGFGTGGMPIWLSLQLSRGPSLLVILAWVQVALAG